MGGRVAGVLGGATCKAASLMKRGGALVVHVQGTDLMNIYNLPHEGSRNGPLHSGYQVGRQCQHLLTLLLPSQASTSCLSDIRRSPTKPESTLFVRTAIFYILVHSIHPI